MRITLTLLVLALTPAMLGCPTMGTNANRGGTTGGLLGAATGAVLAEDNPLGGALVGGTIGALAGSAIGDSVDADIEHQQAVMLEESQRRSSAVTVADVLSMTNSGVTSDVIVDHIKSHGSASHISTDDIIHMTQAKVDSRVIKAMQTHYSQASASPRRLPSRTTHVEHHYVSPPAPFYYRRPVPYRRGVGWGFSFGN
jgi:outer membrane lipoprotein SlyB